MDLLRDKPHDEIVPSCSADSCVRIRAANAAFGASQPARDDLAQLVRASAADHVERRGYQCVGRFTRGGPRLAYADGDHDDSDKDNYPDKSSQVSAPY